MPPPLPGPFSIPSCLRSVLRRDKVWMSRCDGRQSAGRYLELCSGDREAQQQGVTMRKNHERRSAGRAPRRALTSGVAGALVLTGLHEAARRLLSHAPRMDVIGERALSRSLAALGQRSPRGRQLFRATLAGELLSNTLYYSIVGAAARSRALPTGLLIGLAAGLGAVLLPPRLGLGHPPGEKAPLTPLLTIAWYTAGGLAAAAVTRLLDDSETAYEGA